MHYKFEYNQLIHRVQLFEPSTFDDLVTALDYACENICDCHDCPFYERAVRDYREICRIGDKSLRTPENLTKMGIAEILDDKEQPR